ncbi:MAG: ribosomal RNA small subunit methyltransferase A [Acidimicrobiia bacterium]|nr:ribosomal RNA small subunit methyltransferase A [Acidimicrobiia bacterium]
MSVRHTPGKIRHLLDKHGLRPNKSLGQHYLADPNVVDKVVRLGDIDSDDTVVEIGPGTGALTMALVATGADVLAVEIDDRLKPLLAETVGETARILYQDAADLGWVAHLDGRSVKLVANLPYNVGTSLVLDVLRQVPDIATLVVMLQTEVADRLLADAGDVAYGLPSVVVGLTARVGGSFTVPPQLFYPPPAVGSTVIRLDRTPSPPRAEEAMRLAATAFGQRRKMLRASLAGLHPDISELLTSVGLEPTQRPENVPPSGFVDLADALAKT